MNLLHSERTRGPWPLGFETTYIHPLQTRVEKNHQYKNLIRFRPTTAGIGLDALTGMSQRLKKLDQVVLIMMSSLSKHLIRFHLRSRKGLWGWKMNDEMHQ